MEPVSSYLRTTQSTRKLTCANDVRVTVRLDTIHKIEQGASTKVEFVVAASGEAVDSNDGKQIAVSWEFHTGPGIRDALDQGMQQMGNFMRFGRQFSMPGETSEAFCDVTDWLRISWCMSNNEPSHGKLTFSKGGRKLEATLTDSGLHEFAQCFNG